MVDFVLLFFSVSNGGMWNDAGCRRILPADEEIPPDKFNSRCVCNETGSMKYSLLVLEHEATVREKTFISLVSDHTKHTMYPASDFQI